MLEHGLRQLAFYQKRYIFYTMITFEFDEAKSQGNLLKHGIDITPNLSSTGI